MQNYFFVFLVAAILSLIFTSAAKWLSYKIKILDQPGFRKIHVKPIPLMGGAAIYCSFALTLLLFGITAKETITILAIGLIFVVFGLLDDAGIKIIARYKIWSHLLFSALLIYLTGISVNLFGFEPVNWVLTACFITFMTNSMNMLDGMDGLVTGVAGLASVFLFILALNNNLQTLALFAAVLTGTALGFLRYNFNPASIFLGEAGSTFIGYLLAIFGLKLKIFQLWNIALLLNIPRLQFISFVVPVIILGIPIFDTFFVFINRFLHHIKMSTPGTDHSHHRIHLMGLSQRATVLAIYGVQIVLGAIALSMVNADLQQFLSLLLIVGVLVASAWVFLARVEVY